MLITDPPPRSIMWGTASWVRLNAVVTFQRSAPSKAFSVVSMNAWGMVPPALLTTMSMPPSSATAASTSFAMPSRDPRSPSTTTAFRPSASICAATSASWSAVRAPMTTSAPTSAKAVAMRAPMPRPAADTTATLPSSRKRSRITGTSPLSPTVSWAWRWSYRRRAGPRHRWGPTLSGSGRRAPVGPVIGHRGGRRPPVGLGDDVGRPARGPQPGPARSRHPRRRARC